METTNTDRLVRHIRAENSARVGYDYAERKSESDWAEQYLPKTRREFAALVKAVHSSGWGALGIEIGAILLGTVTVTTGAGTVLGKNNHPELVASWGVEKQAHGKSRKCQTCGAPAVGMSNFGGLACSAHYDEFS